MFKNEHQLAWDDFRIILAVARRGSLKSAAAALGSSHPTLFRRIRDIEQVLGLSLFVRSRQGYHPTEAAAVFIALAEKIEHEVLGLATSGVLQPNVLAGQVSLSVAPVFMPSLLAPILQSLAVKMPQIQLQISSSTRLVDLSQHEADIALRSGGQPPEHLIGTNLGRMAVCAYQPASWAPAEPKHWKHLPWVTPDESFSHQDSVAWLKSEGHFERATVRCDNIEHVALLANAGIGLAVLPCYLGDRCAGLVRASAPIPEFTSDLWLLWHPQWRGVKRITAVVEHISAELIGQKALIEGAGLLSRSPAEQ